MDLNFAHRVVASPSVLFRRVREEAVLLNLADEYYFDTDETGARMWILLTSAPSIGQAYDSLREEYEVDADRLRSDLEAFVRDLVTSGLVRVERG